MPQGHEVADEHRDHGHEGQQGLCGIVGHPAGERFAHASERQHAQQCHEADDLRHEREQRGVRRRGALKHVRRVKVKRHGRDAEAQAGDEKREGISGMTLADSSDVLRTTSAIAAKFVLPATP